MQHTTGRFRTWSAVQEVGTPARPPARPSWGAVRVTHVVEVVQPRTWQQGGWATMNKQLVDSMLVDVLLLHRQLLLRFPPAPTPRIQRRRSLKQRPLARAQQVQ